MKLTIELVPKGAWDNNLRSYLTGTQWDKVRRKCYAEAGHVCEICGGYDQKRKDKGHSPVDCHERWDFSEGVVKLVGLISLCPSCHEVKHIGLAEARGNFRRALHHFMKVNKISEADALHHIKDAARLWRKRNQEEWDLDIDYLEVYMGEKLKDSKKPKKVVDIAGEAF